MNSYDSDNSSNRYVDYVGGPGPFQLYRQYGPDSRLMRFNVPTGQHFYGLDENGNTLLRPLAALHADMSTQCELQPWDVLEVIRDALEWPFPIWPDAPGDSTHTFFSKCVLSSKAMGKFSISNRGGAGRGNRSIGISVTRADFIDPQETEDRRGFNVFALRNREWKCSDAEQSVSEDGYEYDPYDKSP